MVPVNTVNYIEFCSTHRHFLPSHGSFLFILFVASKPIVGSLIRIEYAFSKCSRKQSSPSNTAMYLPVANLRGLFQFSSLVIFCSFIRKSTTKGSDLYSSEFRNRLISETVLSSDLLSTMIHSKFLNVWVNMDSKVLLIVCS